MSITTNIEYCDSTVNGQMGCDGCELWAPDEGIRVCYAGSLIDHGYKGLPGWPEEFGKPKLFPERILKACRWGWPTPQSRAEKPWLLPLPRVIFFDDMGDTWTESLPIDWLKPYLEMLENSGHVLLFLTKRPRRMLKFFRDSYVGTWMPRNFWLGCSFVERKSFAGRLAAMKDLRKTFPQVMLWASWEPAYEPLPWDGEALRVFDWFVFGGESEPKSMEGIVQTRARPSHPDWFRSTAQLAGDFGISRFFKQWGAWVPICELNDADQDRLYKAAPRRAGPEASRRCLVDTTVFNSGGTESDDYRGPSPMMMMKVGKHRAGALLGGKLLREMPDWKE